jgi:hypothetical protein
MIKTPVRIKSTGLTAGLVDADDKTIPLASLVETINAIAVHSMDADDDLIDYICCEISHDLRESEERRTRVRWNNEAMARVINRVTTLEATLTATIAEKDRRIGELEKLYEPFRPLSLEECEAAFDAIDESEVEPMPDDKVQHGVKYVLDAEYRANYLKEQLDDKTRLVVAARRSITEAQAKLAAVEAERDDAIKERDARGEILDRIQAATGSTWRHGAIEWANRVFAAIHKADSTPNYQSKVTRELVPAFIRQLAKERDHANRMYQTAAELGAEFQKERDALRAELSALRQAAEGAKRELECIIGQATERGWTSGGPKRVVAALTAALTRAGIEAKGAGE